MLYLTPFFQILLNHSSNSISSPLGPNNDSINPPKSNIFVRLKMKKKKEMTNMGKCQDKSSPESKQRKRCLGITRRRHLHQSPRHRHPTHHQSSTQGLFENPNWERRCRHWEQCYIRSTRPQQVLQQGWRSRERSGPLKLVSCYWLKRTKVNILSLQLLHFTRVTSRGLEHSLAACPNSSQLRHFMTRSFVQSEDRCPSCLSQG